MKIDTNFKNKLEKYFDMPVIVEGKKDVSSLEVVGFKRIYAIHQNSVSLGERVEQIAFDMRRNGEKKVCILTDFDKKGKELYFLLKKLFQEQGMQVDRGLRSLLFRAGISHVEGLAGFIEREFGLNLFYRA